MADGESEFPIWDEYAHVYIMGLKDYIDKQPAQEFERPELQRIYDFGRFARATKR